MIAALFVQKNGSYYGIPGVDPWDEERDARRYSGPHPVVAHPPCACWCRLAPVNAARWGTPIGEDGGCFEAALRFVRTYGGVLEHPAYSLAWDAFALARPQRGSWSRDLFCGGWVTHVMQRVYGHPARKGTWLYAYGVSPPDLLWGMGENPIAWVSSDRPRAELAKLGISQLMGKYSSKTPTAFRDVLLQIAASARRGIR